MKRDSFLFYDSFLELLESLPDKNRLHLYDAIVAYGLREEEPTIDHPLEKSAWKHIYKQLSANWKKVRNGQKGGAKKGDVRNPSGKNQHSNEKDLGLAEDYQRISRALPEDYQSFSRGLAEDYQRISKNTSINNKNIIGNNKKGETNHILTISNDIVRHDYIDIQDSSEDKSSSSSCSRCLDSSCEKPTPAEVGMSACSADAPSASGAKEEFSFSLSELKDFFNDKIVENNSSIPKITTISSNRKTLLVARIKEYGVEGVKLAFDKATKSDFLNARCSRTFTASFDWIIKPNNFPKVLEGNYDNQVMTGSEVGCNIHNTSEDKYETMTQW